MPATYEFLYFNGHGLGMIPRLLLSLGGFDWKDVHPKVCDPGTLYNGVDLAIKLVIELGRRKELYPLHAYACIDRAQ